MDKNRNMNNIALNNISESLNENRNGCLSKDDNRKRYEYI